MTWWLWTILAMVLLAGIIAWLLCWSAAEADRRLWNQAHRRGEDARWHEVWTRDR